jgi:outer membrane lipopolysaccharide assembly protein LptE/RlpB
MNTISRKKNGFREEPNFLMYLFFLILVFLLLSSCGYTNPYVQKNTQENLSKNLQITTWQNRTNELGLESVYFRLFNAWFKKSGLVNVVQEDDQADLKLTGEISSIDLPGLFYDTFDEALEVKIKLAVSFTLYDNHSKTILWQEKQFTVYEPFLLDPAREKALYNKEKALLRIGDEISELIYLRTHEIVSNMPYVK